MKKIISILLVFSITLIPTSTFAITDDILRFYNLNKIYYYNPDGGECGPVQNILTGTYNGATSAGLSSLQAGFIDTYHNIAEQLSIQYGIPWETVMAQGIVESASGTSNFARTRNNFFGIGAFDSNPDAARRYNSPEDGWRGYYENITNTATYRNHGAFSGENITNPYTYLTTIKNAGYATDPNYISKISTYIRAIENRAIENGWLRSEELAQKNPEMITNASRYASGNISNTLYNYSENGSIIMNCTTNSSSNSSYIPVGNGSINQTAIALAWPSSGHSLYEPTSAYRSALEQTGVNRLGDRWSKMGASCDAFVATVLRYSGADPNFFCCGVSSGGMLRYILTSNKYTEIQNHSNTSNLAGGDIIINSHHVAIIVQLSNGSFAIADASHGERTAEIHPIYNLRSYRIFRKR